MSDEKTKEIEEREAARLMHSISGRRDMGSVAEKLRKQREQEKKRKDEDEARRKKDEEDKKLRRERELEIIRKIQTEKEAEGTPVPSAQVPEPLVSPKYKPAQGEVVAESVIPQRELTPEEIKERDEKLRREEEKWMKMLGSKLPDESTKIHLQKELEKEKEEEAIKKATKNLRLGIKEASALDPKAFQDVAAKKTADPESLISPKEESSLFKAMMADIARPKPKHPSKPSDEELLYAGGH